jgi:hypothetical protein
VFNSHAIELNIHNIPGLSDLFVYSNDDLMFARNVTVHNFFNDDFYYLFAGDFYT